VLSDRIGEETAIEPARHVVPRGYRTIFPRIGVEADGVGDTGRFAGEFAKTPYHEPILCARPRDVRKQLDARRVATALQGHRVAGERR
jgi:hypothetical protein